MKNDKRLIEEELKIVSRPSNEEIEDDFVDKPKKKWKKIPTQTMLNQKNNQLKDNKYPSK